MGKIGKIIVILIAVIYIISPVDGMPGPIDDIIVAFINSLYNEVNVFFLL